MRKAGAQNAFFDHFVLMLVAKKLLVPYKLRIHNIATVIYMYIQFNIHLTIVIVTLHNVTYVYRDLSI